MTYILLNVWISFHNMDAPRIGFILSKCISLATHLYINSAFISAGQIPGDGTDESESTYNFNFSSYSKCYSHQSFFSHLN